MSEPATQAQPAAATAETSTPATPSGGAMSDADVMAGVYAAMEEGGEASNDTAMTETPVAGEAKPEAKAEPEKPAVETPKEEPKVDEKEIIAAVQEIEKERAEIAKQKAEAFETAKKLQSRHDKQERVSKELTAREEALKVDRQKFDVEKQAYQEHVRKLLEGDIDTKIEALVHLTGSNDPVKLFERLSESTVNANPRERALERELASIKAMLQERDTAHLKQQEEQTRKQREEAEQATLMQQYQQGDVQVRTTLGNLAVNLSTEDGAKRFPQYAEIAALVDAHPQGAQGAQAVLYEIGQRMVKAGIEMSFDRAPYMIAADAVTFLRTQQGQQFLAGLRAQKQPVVQAQPAQTQPGPGTRIPTPGASLPAATASAMGGSLSDVPRTEEEAIEAWKQVSPVEFAKACLPDFLLEP